MVTAHLGNWRAQHDEQMMLLAMSVQTLANVRKCEHGVGFSAVQGRVQPVLDGRADEQRELRVVGAQMHSATHWSALPEQRQRDLEQGLDVGHSQQAEAHSLATAGVNTVMLLVQLMGRGQGQPGEFGIQRGRVVVAFQWQWDELAAASWFIQRLL